MCTLVLLKYCSVCWQTCLFLSGQFYNHLVNCLKGAWNLGNGHGKKSCILETLNPVTSRESSTNTLQFPLVGPWCHFFTFLKFFPLFCHLLACLSLFVYFALNLTMCTDSRCLTNKIPPPIYKKYINNISHVMFHLSLIQYSAVKDTWITKVLWEIE